MAFSKLLVFLGLLRVTLSVPLGQNQTYRLPVKNAGVPGQNLTYDYIVRAVFPFTPIPWIK